MVALTIVVTIHPYVITQAVQPKGGIKRFCIDPSEYTDFEIANHLWSLMEKGTYADAETSTVGMSAE